MTLPGEIVKVEIMASLMADCLSWCLRAAVMSHSLVGYETRLFFHSSEGWKFNANVLSAFKSGACLLSCSQRSPCCVSSEGGRGEESLLSLFMGMLASS